VQRNGIGSFVKALSLEERSLVQFLGRLKLLHPPNEPTIGCHMAAQVWATWDHPIRWFWCHLSTVGWCTCLYTFLVRNHTSYLYASYPAMCHRMVGPRSTCMTVPRVTLPMVTCVTFWLVHISCKESLPYQIYNLPIMALPRVTLPRQHDDVNIEFFIVDLFDFLLVWKNGQSEKTLAYDAHLRN